MIVRKLGSTIIERLAADSGVIFKIIETVDEKWQDLERAFYQRIRKEAKAVEFEPETIPAVLVARPLSQNDKRGAELDAMGAQLGLSSSAIKQMFHTMAKLKSQREAGEDTILQLNAHNPLIRQLRDMPRNETFYLALTCIYNNAVMFAHHSVSPENAEIIFAANNSAFSAMITTAQVLAQEQQERAKMELERDRLKRQLPDMPLTEYRSCFFAFDYKIEDNYRLLEAIQTYFDRNGLGIKVMAPAKAMDDLNIHRDLHRQLKQAHFGIAEVSNNNLNVLYESGLLHGMGKPLILLQRSDSTDTIPFDILSDYRCKYVVLREGGDVEFGLLEKNLDKAMDTLKRMQPNFDTLPKWEGKQ
ncbi:MAG: hypothetical protein WCI11_11005 [Candidatus Methylumidiphilus sp.]